MESNTIQEKLKKYITEKMDNTQELDDETIQDITESLISCEDIQSMEKMNNEEFGDFMEMEVNINIMETNEVFLNWYYEDENSPFTVIQDIVTHGNINCLVKSLFNDYTYQFKNGLIINLMF